MKRYFYNGHFFSVKELPSGRFMAKMIFGFAMFIATNKKRVIKKTIRHLEEKN